jgi:glycosyltransferase involved in cell wall biosynthesis
MKKFLDAKSVRSSGVKRKICIIGNFEFPDGNSSGLRVLGNGYLFRSIGYDVTYIGLSKNIRDLTGIKPSCKYFEDFRYYDFPYPATVKEWVFFKKKIRCVKSIILDESPDVVISYGSLSNSLFSIFLANFCRAKAISYVPDVVDWLAVLSGGRLFRLMKWMDTQIQKRVANKLGKGLIMISSCQMRYYDDLRPKLVLPPLSTNSTEVSLEESDAVSDRPLTLLYAGYPFSIDKRVRDSSKFKDRLDASIELLFRCRDLDFNFNIYGLNEEEYLSVIPNHLSMIRKMRGKVFFKGNLPRSDVLNATKSTDFMFLFRDKNRMTDFGFPTKLVEALSLGTPVITTATSDIRDYIVDGQNGYILDHDNRDAAVLRLRSIISGKGRRTLMSREKIINQKLFSPNNFVNNTVRFLEKVSSR